MEEISIPVKISEEEIKNSEQETEKKNWWEIIQKYSLYLLIFFTPLFFLPFTYAPLSINKEFLVSTLTLIGLFAFLGSAITKGKIERPKNILNLAVLSLLFSWGLSTIFSKARVFSIGFLGGEPESLINIFTFSFIFFLASVTFQKKEELFRALILFLSSSVIVSIFSILQLFGFYPLAAFSSRFSFTAFSDFNSIGSVNVLALYLSLVWILILALLSFFKFGKLTKIFFVISGIFAVFNLFLINFFSSWVVLTLGSLFIFSLKYTLSHKPQSANYKIVSLPLFSFVIAVAFLATGLINRYSGIINFRFPLQAAIPIEISPNWQSTISIAMEVLKERPVWGSGPGTFFANWTKYRSQDLNNDPVFGSLALTSFRSGVAALPTLASTVGLLGISSLFFLFAVFFIKGVGEIFKTEDFFEKYFLIFFLAVSSLFLFWFLYPLNYTLAVLTFLFLGFWLASFIHEGRVKFIIKPLFGSPQKVMLISMTMMLLMVIAVGLIYFNSQRYLAAIYFGKWLKNQNVSYLVRAVNLDQAQTLYLRNLAKANISQLSQTLAQTQDSKEETKNNFQQLSSSAINAASLAVNRINIDPQNWVSLAQVYEALIGLAQGAEDQAIEAYKKAEELDPKNPFYSLSMAMVLSSKANLLSKETKSAVYEEALKSLDRAISLKSNYTSAYFLKSQIENSQGNFFKAIRNAEIAKSLNPNDLGIIFQLGSIYYQENRFSQAKAEFLRALEISPNYSNARYFLGLIYDREGNKAKAQEEFEKILSLNPGNQEVLRILENFKTGLPALP